MSGRWGRTRYSRSSSLLLDSPFRSISNSTPCGKELSNLRRTKNTVGLSGKLIASLARRRLELGLLRIPLSSQLAAFRLAIEISARTIVESGMEIHPNLSLGITNISGRRWGLGDPEANQHLFEKSELRFLRPASRIQGRCSGGCRSTDLRTSKAPVQNRKQEKKSCDGHINISPV